MVEDMLDYNQFLKNIFLICSNFEEFHAEPTEFLCIDDKVIVFGRYRGQTKIGKNFIVPFCHLYTIKDGKIFRFNQYTDTHIINEALTG
jgi:ketosteroid isomerase-like protein